MFTSTVDEAQVHLAHLIGLAEGGEEIVIAREGKPVARIVPYQQTDKPREGGQWHGRIHVAPDFDDLPSTISEAFGLPES